MKYIFIAAVFLIVLGCSRQEDNNANANSAPTLQEQTQGPATSILIGEWLKPIEGQEGKTDGVKLNADGSAESVNSATLLYNSWETDGKSLTLAGTSIGNGVSSDFTAAYQIEELSENKLVLRMGQNVFTYTKTN